MNQRQTLSILFYLRRDKKTRNGEVPIYMRITVNGKRSEMAIHRLIHPNRWNNEGGHGRGSKTEIKLLNEFLDLQRSKVYEAQRDLIEENKPVTALTIRNRVQGKSDAKHTLFSVFSYHNKLMEEQVPAEYSPTTLTRYKTTLKHIQEFVKYKYKVEDLFLSQLNHEFVSSLDHYFKINKKCNHNTSAKYIKNLKKVINLALKNDWISRDPFINYSAKIKPVKREYLTWEELKFIEEVELSVERLARVRDVFVFTCYTGLAYVDVERLTPENIEIGIDGESWVKVERHKTKTRSSIMLLPMALEIIEKYSLSPDIISAGKLLPVISNQRMNAYLKEIANMAGIKKNLTCHLARHTFATTVTLAQGVPIESVSEMLGHKSMRTTQIYAKVIDKKVSEDMIKLRTRMLEESIENRKDSNGE
ncbi:MAG: site-specific integrase [Bacteroidales bacterium]